MTPDVLAAKVETIISKAEKFIATQATSSQNELFEQMSIMLNKLELDSEGLIKQSQANRAVLGQAETYFNKAMGDYYASLDIIGTTITGITTLNSDYFDIVINGFKPDTQFIKSLQKQTIAQAEILLANEGIELTLKQPILNILNQNINTSASYTDLLSQLQNFIKGSPSVDGALTRYSKQIVTDTLFNYNRAVQEAISANSGLEWIKYVGGAMDTSREFCLSRIGRYWHKTEVEKWANLSWAGQRKGTNSSTIFIYAGGYNCRHQIIYVATESVPKKVRDRVRFS